VPQIIVIYKRPPLKALSFSGGFLLPILPC
jgi:hypothetical protein